jgi:hypothetical protein
MHVRTLAPVVLLLFGFAATASAQSRFQYGGGALLGTPTGALGKQIGNGGGVGGHALWSTHGGVFGLRLDGSLFLYGGETFRVPAPREAGHLTTRVTTDNWTGHATVGPQLMAPSGPLRPYLHAFAGVGYYSTTTEVTDPSVRIAPLGPARARTASSTDYDDAAFAYGAGAGVLVPLGGRGVALDAGARYVRDGRVSYLTEGDRLTPRSSTGSLVEFRLGLTVVR